MKQQVLEQRLAEIEAIASNALKTGQYASAVLAIIKIVGEGQDVSALIIPVIFIVVLFVVTAIYEWFFDL